MNITSINHYGDMLAIPWFIALILYFYNIENRSILEDLLLVFSILGFLVDAFLTYHFLRKT